VSKGEHVDMTGKRILVTGSSGFIGSRVLERLNNSQDNLVIGLDKKNVQSDSCNITADLSENDSVDLIRAFNPEVIIHAAAQSDVMRSISDPIEDLKANVISTLNIIKAIDDMNCECVIYLNTGGATYEEAPSPRFENSPLKPQSPYGISKQAGELYFELFNLQSHRRFVSLALSNVYGPLQDNKKGVIYNFIEAIKTGKEIQIFGANSTRDYIHVDDVVDSILLAMETNIVGRFNISTGIPTENIQVFNIVAEALQIKREPTLLPARKGEMVYSVLSNAKFCEATGWKPRILLAEGINGILEIDKSPSIS
jgi:UDP-glucose 4-epimerase